MTQYSSDRAPTLATWVAFSALCVGMFMAVLDTQVVAASLPDIRAALNIPPEHMSSIQTGYLIAEVVAIPLTGVLTRALGLRRLAVLSLAAFVLASIGCALSATFGALLFWRLLQGLAGGLLIPQVFAAGFVLFPGRGQALATTLAGVLAVLAPTIGPFVGGWITDSYSWPWLFLINVAPGVAAIAAAQRFLAPEPVDPAFLRNLDFAAFALMVLALACLEIGLRHGPQAGWSSPTTAALLGITLGAGSLFVRRTWASEHPIVDLHALADPKFALGCLLSFILGVGLYGSIYLVPAFLAFVRYHSAFEIGQTMMVMGAAQLVVAPLAVAAERRISARLLTAGGFALFACGLALSAFQTRATDFESMLVPQIIRGSAIMFCLLPPIRLALGHLSPEAVPNASGLFNVLRNLGGAIGLAFIDTVLYGRTPEIAQRLGEGLARGDVATAQRIGLPLERFLAHVPGTPLDPQILAYVQAAVRRQAMVEAVNEAWLMVALLTMGGALAVLLPRAAKR
jgi:MFS transporter, DHA2 family, multidrug resistance protein